MQVNRLSFGLQEELKTASHYNTARADTLFGNPANETNAVNFADLEVSELNISEDKIAVLLGSFTNEVIKAFGAKMPQILAGDNPLKTSQDETADSSESSTVYTA